MNFEWNEKKDEQNLAKHGLSFAGGALVFLDPDRIELIDDRKNYGEVRYTTIGSVNNNIIIYVIYTIRGKNYRLISARRANKDERETYLQHK